MCTVTYIPQGPDSFVLSSNRDESPARSPRNLTRLETPGSTLLFPRDTAAGGSWIVADNHNRVVCLLNGAFEKHRHSPPYKKSRGLMVLNFFDFSRAGAFASEYDFEGMEPFTFIILEKGRLFELRWDEKEVHFRELDAKAYQIWSSATLYTEEVREKRQGWFRNWLANRSDWSLEAIHSLHRYGGEGDPWNDYVMDRNGVVQTVSITHIHKKPGKLDFIYHDLLRQDVKTESLVLQPAPREA